MTPRQIAFVREYLHDQNATRAMVRAGYSARTANHHCARLMQHPEVGRLIRSAKGDRETALRLHAVETLIAKLEAAKQSISIARTEILRATRRVRAISQQIADIEQLAAASAPASKSEPDLKRAATSVQKAQAATVGNDFQAEDHEPPFPLWQPSQSSFSGECDYQTEPYVPFANF